MPQVWNTWAMLFQVKASRRIIPKFKKSSIGLNQRTSEHSNLFLALPTSVVVSLNNIPKKSLLSLPSLKKILPSSSMTNPSQLQIHKEAFTTAPILSHFTPSLQTIVETHASDYAFGAILSQVNDSGKHPIAFHRCKLLPAEFNHGIHDKELLGIVWALNHQSVFLLSLSKPFEVLTDHSYLQYFISSKVLMSACDSKPEHKHDSQNTINQWYSQNTTKTWS
ncbi:hypothetical protein O181_078784 [Austropuccinia psidii MF-1]|uniref:Reverse transcriptase RNase H-like domain-containing protein n=1 Tax=Austropuccinia psidii MF-1 TaxID=1389203 RepID=A0A9Q3FH65_9BASI|nr:hypothetical protein [Austropuccinia psidii MF-1]